MHTRWGIQWIVGAVSAAFTVVVVCAVFTPALARAHPGHGHTAPDAPAHYAVEPVHVVPIAVGVVLAILILAVTVLARWWARAKP